MSSDNDDSMPVLLSSDDELPDDDSCMESDDDEVALPSDDSAADDNMRHKAGQETQRFAGQCCKKCCMQRADLVGLACKQKASIHAGSHAEGDAFLMNLIGSTCQISTNGSVTWKIGAHIICRSAWITLHGLSRARVGKIVKALLTTRVPPEDRRKYNGNTGERKNPSITCHAFFTWMYEHMAEPLAEDIRDDAYLDDADDLFRECEARECDLDSDLSFVHLDIECRETKWLATQTIPDMYATMECWLRSEATSIGSLPSQDTFRRVYAVWRPKLKIRAAGTHSRCTFCAETSKRLEACQCPQERADIRASHMRHLKSMFADRDLEMRANKLSEASCADESSMSGRVLKVDIDGMDQAKFKAPRNISNAKATQDLWRPSIHVVGIIVWGLLEAYILMEPDIPKDSSMQITMLCTALHFASQALASKKLEMPLHLIVQADNTCRETKNNPFLTFVGMLVTWGIFKSVTVQFHRVGHTHGPIDQRFSVVATVISRKKVLETLSDFARAIKRGVKPVGKRQLITYICNVTYDFQQWLWLNLGISTPGITPNPQANELHTNHCWRLLRRCDLPSLEKANAEEWEPEELDVTLAHENDACLLLKEWESSQCLTQSPLVLIPFVLAQNVRDSCPDPMPRTPLGKDALREYRKTAQLIRQSPWEHVKAADWLEAWTLANERGQSAPIAAASDAFPIIWWSDRMLGRLAVDPLGWQRFAPYEILVRRVSVTRTQRPKPKKRAKPDAPPSAAQDAGGNEQLVQVKPSTALMVRNISSSRDGTVWLVTTSTCIVEIL